MTRVHRQWGHALVARAHVVDHVLRPAGRGRMAPRPLIEFEAEGQTVRFSGPAGASPHRWRVGQSVEVAYDPLNPERVRLGGNHLAGFWPLVVGVATLVGFIALVST
jgi:Protein of unknown function (DUF3592)